MKRKLLKQIANEWRSNLWLSVELLVVSVVMWYVTDYLSTAVITNNIPMGIETDNCFLATFSRIPMGNPSRVDNDTTTTTMADSHRRIIDRMRANPDVEGVASVAYHAIPYTHNTNSIRIEEADGVDSLASVYTAWREVSPEYMTVFRVKGCNGETPEELADMIRRDEWLLSANIYTYDKRLERDSTKRHTSG